jgi:D-sedoheptulose 7-phosphate isomerase
LKDDETVHAALLRQAMLNSIAAKQAFIDDPERLRAFDRAVECALAVYRNGGRIYVAGNGGSAADAQHLAAELVCRLERERGPLPAEAMTVDSSLLTAVANDYGFEWIFHRQVMGRMEERDMLVAISTSGNSPNILRALEACRQRGIPSLLLSGRDGGQAAALADHRVLAPGESVNTIQELHIVFVHALCASIENALIG